MRFSEADLLSRAAICGASSFSCALRGRASKICNNCCCAANSSAELDKVRRRADYLQLNLRKRAQSPKTRKLTLVRGGFDRPSTSGENRRAARAELIPEVTTSADYSEAGSTNFTRNGR